MSQTVVATDICAPDDPLIPVSLDCSLCALGWPMAGGRVMIEFFREPCPPETTPQPTYWLGFEPRMAMLQCVNPGTNAEPDPSRWAAEGTFGGISALDPVTGEGHSNQYRWRANLTVTDRDTINCSVRVEVLGPGNAWQSYTTFGASMKEVMGSDPSPWRGRNYKSEYLGISVALAGGVGDPVTRARITVGIQGMRFGCGGFNQGDPLCGLWDGVAWHTCVRAHLEPTGKVPSFVQLGRNPDPCGGVTQQYCWCDRITLRTDGRHEAEVNLDPQFLRDYATLGLDPANLPYDLQQQIQIGGSLFLKKIEGRPLIAGYLNTTGVWEFATPAEVSAGYPYLMRAAFASATVTYYSARFPSDPILPGPCRTPPEAREAPAIDLSGTDRRVLERIQLPCAYLGQKIESRPMKCRCGNVDIYACSKYGECTRVINDGLKCCATCDTYIGKVQV